MKIGDLTELAGRNLRESILRNSLTTLGITVGVASLVAMLSLGVGLQQLINRHLAHNGLFNSVLVRPSPAITGRRQGQRFLGGNPTENSTVLPRPLDETARRELERLHNVIEVYPELLFTADARLKGGDRGRIARVASLPPSASSSDAFEGMQGHFFSSPGAHEAILQSDLAGELAKEKHLPSSALIGKEIVLRYAGREPLAPATPDPEEAPRSPQTAMGFSIISSQIAVPIVGIVDSAVASAGGGLRRSSLYLPLALVEKLGAVQGSDLSQVVRESTAGKQPNYASLTVRVDDPANVPSVESAIEKMGYTTFSFLDVSSRLRRVFAILDLLLGIFGSLALAVASLGIINTLVMAILERRREIGVLKALGASDGDIRRLFFAEAGVMGLAGGLAGVGLGWAIGRAIQFATTLYLRQRSIPAENIWSVPWWLILSAIGFSVAVSLAAGIYPASRAARLDPVEALRYE